MMKNCNILIVPAICICAYMRGNRVDRLENVVTLSDKNSSDKKNRNFGLVSKILSHEIFCPTEFCPIRYRFAKKDKSWKWSAISLVCMLRVCFAISGRHYFTSISIWYSRYQIAMSMFMNTVWEEAFAWITSCDLCWPWLKRRDNIHSRKAKMRKSIPKNFSNREFANFKAKKWGF